MIAVTKMRKGHDFHKDKDVGELVKPWPMREKYPCVWFSLPYPTTFIEELLLVVEAFNCFGSGVAGLLVLNLMHTPPWLTSLWLGKMTAITHTGILHSPHDCAKILTHSLIVAIDCLFIYGHKQSCVSSRMVSIVWFSSRTGSLRFGLT